MLGAPAHNLFRLARAMLDHDADVAPNGPIVTNGQSLTVQTFTVHIRAAAGESVERRDVDHAKEVVGKVGGTLSPEWQEDSGALARTGIRDDA
jgi:hypothetical protein